jgi:mannose-1-phosphate guanylyltransferase/mannose-6-phosphate isomerase
MTSDLRVIILAGGSGTRLWPLSRQSRPKQFLNLTSQSETMLQLTVRRTLDLRPRDFVVVCHQSHNLLVRDQLEPFDISYQLVNEPVGRNTAPAIATACLLSRPDDLLLIVPCDHQFSDSCFLEAVTEARMAIDDESIVVLGIKPVYPETGYGYLLTGDDPLEGRTYRLRRFIEKPSLERAEEYLRQKCYWWNAGIFLFRNQTMLEEMSRHCPDILKQVRKTLAKSAYREGAWQLDSTEFAKIRDRSIDYAVMEHHQKGKMVSYDGEWSDIGSFQALYECLPKDGNGNVIRSPEIFVHDSENCFIHSDRGLVSTVGLRDVLIVQQRDALLVADLSKSQDVRHIVELIRASDRSEPKRLIGGRATRACLPWGWSETLDAGESVEYRIRRVVVHPGQSTPFESCHQCSKHWVFAAGEGEVETRDSSTVVKSGSQVKIVQGEHYRVRNTGEVDLELVETEIASCREEDIVSR